MSAASISFPFLGNWSICPPNSFTLFGHTFYWYGVIIGVGFLLGVIYCFRRGPRDFGVSTDTLTDAVLIGLPSALVGARLFYVFGHWEQYLGDSVLSTLWNWCKIWEGGSAIPGGLMLVLWDELVLRLDLSGDLLALGAALTWAGYTLLMRRLLKQGISPLMLTLGVVAYTLFEALPVALWCGYALKADALMTPVNLLNLLFLGVIATSVCYFTWNRALEFIGPLRCTAYLYLQPVITAAGAALLISERLSMLKAAGMALVLLGLLCSERDPARRSHKKLPPAGSREHRAKDYGGRPREAHGEL